VGELDSPKGNVRSRNFITVAYIKQSQIPALGQKSEKKLHFVKYLYSVKHKINGIFKFLVPETSFWRNISDSQNIDLLKQGTIIDDSVNITIRQTTHSRNKQLFQLGTSFSQLLDAVAQHFDFSESNNFN